ncbi:ThiF family protein [Herbihabitans rhizosphaerae]|uniref:ThiF family protein n=1 Tax=Herbihabitans rhizosphaerae TaxID=1872711 RepID=A0A4Q7KEG5_9PSEU|nr:hypothetical protein [Herbihabitans rhizosphaerae]RZS32232.1 ThiF family protein [Herbihabitans rhizosphaerae]
MDVDTRTTLPVRPRSLPGLPVLRRRAGEIQVGLDPAHAVVISDLPDGVVTVAGALDGTRSVDELLDEVGPADSDTLLALLDELEVRGLLVDAASTAVPARLTGDVTMSVLRTRGRDRPVPPAVRPDQVVVRGDGPLAVAVAATLAGAGMRRVHVAATGAVQPEDVGCGYLDAHIGLPRRRAARDVVRAVDPSVLTGPPRRGSASLVVLTDAVVPDPEAVAELVRHGVAHLVVRVREGTGVIGPLVVPGRSSCLRCADLVRAGLDPCWPAVATQLLGATQPVDVLSAQVTAALAAAQALRALDWFAGAGPRPPTWCGAVEIDPFTGVSRHRRWPIHAACTCGAKTRMT